MKELWKPVKGFENKYEISNLGRLKNIQTNHILKMTNKKGDYFAIVLQDGNKKKSARIHRLVAEHFIPNPYNFNCVNHIDMNKQNNRVDNLEWCSCSHNVTEAIKQKRSLILNGIHSHNKDKSYKKYGIISQYELDGTLVNKYYSSMNASLISGVCERNILQCINGEQGRKQAGGYIWKCEKEVM